MWDLLFLSGIVDLIVFIKSVHNEIEEEIPYSEFQKLFGHMM